MEALQRFIALLRESAILRQQVYQILIGAVALAGAQLDIPFIAEKAEVAIDLVLQLSAVGIAFYTMWTRYAKPNPNLSKAADEKEAELVADGTIPLSNATHKIAITSRGKP